MSSACLERSTYSPTYLYLRLLKKQSFKYSSRQIANHFSETKPLAPNTECDQFFRLGKDSSKCVLGACVLSYFDTGCTFYSSNEVLPHPYIHCVCPPGALCRPPLHPSSPMPSFLQCCLLNHCFFVICKCHVERFI